MNLLRRFAIFLVAVVVGFVAPVSTYALTEEQLKFNAQVGNYFYDPDAGDCILSADVRADSDGSDVYMIGDSITVSSEAKIKELMPNINVNAANGIYFSHDDDEFGVSGVSRISGIGERSILLFALGTNGGIDQLYNDDTQKFFDATNGKNIKVILMTIFYDGINLEQMNNTNNIVKDLASRYDNITYMDWYSAASKNPGGYISDDKVNLTPDGQVKFAELAKEAVDKVSIMNIPTNAGDRDYTRVLNAKNADQYVFNLDKNNPGEWHAGWSDKSTESMARVLNHYGDLAYQLGDAIGVPWVAIIVQMRYEDSRSVCGANNFWGNGCPPGTGAGGATIQGRNLGEGFMQYGKTLTEYRNGEFYAPALGISDPKQYLEVLGPLWVQGNPNGSGYGSIDGMKHSIDAMMRFIESDEGQAIVKTFGNYHGTAGSYSVGRAVCSESTTDPAWNGEPVFYQQSDPRWGSIPYNMPPRCRDTQSRTISSSGCGPTSLASIIATMTGDLSVTPDVIAMKALEKGYRVCGGTASSVARIAKDYGLKVMEPGEFTHEIDVISNYLRQGWMFHIDGNGPEPFSDGGHFIAIRGITDDGKWLVFDSSHSGRNDTKEWDPEGIFRSATGRWYGIHK